MCVREAVLFSDIVTPAVHRISQSADHQRIEGLPQQLKPPTVQFPAWRKALSPLIGPFAVAEPLVEITSPFWSMRVGWERVRGVE